jgi:lipopolysaccharide export system permease protein
VETNNGNAVISKIISMLTKIDLYIIRKFLGTFFFSILIIMSIAIIFDIQEKFDDFIKNKAPLYDIIFNYYVHFVPYYANLFSSLFVFISVVYFTSRMANDTEIIAIHASGVSFSRFLRPYIISASILAVLSWFLIMYIIPQSNKIRLDFEDTYVFNRVQNWDQDIHRQVRPGVFIYIQSYNVDTENAFRFSMEKFENGKLVSKLNSAYAKWNKEKESWTVFDYYIRDITPTGDSITTGYSLDTVFYLTPSDFTQRNVYVERMTLGELNEHIEIQKLQGTGNVNLLLVHKYQRWAYPFSTFILTILGVSIANKKKRGSTVVNVVIGLMLMFSYILFMQISTTFTIKAHLDPLISVWIPNVVYAIIAMVLFFKAKI